MDDTLTLNGLSAIANLDVSNLYADDIQTSNIVVDTFGLFQSDVRIKGNVTIDGDLNVTFTGISVINNPLTIKGDTTIENSLLVYNNLTVGGNLAFNSFNVSNASTIQNSFYVSDSQTIGGSLYVTGNITTLSSIAVAGSQSIGGTLCVTGDSTFSNNLYAKNYLKLNYSGAITDNNKLGVLYNGKPLIATTQDHIAFCVPSQSGLSRLLPNDTIDNVYIIVSDSKNNNAQTINSNLNLNALTTINNSLNVINNLTVAGTIYGNISPSGGNISISGNLTIGNALVINGGSTFNNSLVINGGSTFSNTIVINGGSTFNNTLVINGGSTFNNTLVINGGTTVNNTIVINNTATFNNTIIIKGGTTINNILIVTGSTTINNILLVTGASTFNNNLSIAGKASIGEVGTPINYDLDIRRNANDVSLGISNRNTNGYSLLALNNDVGSGLVMFNNGSNRSADGGTNTTTIRNDLAGKIRLQNNYEFGFGNPENITGDPSTAPLMQGTSLNDQFVFHSTVFSSPYIYVAGWYLSASNITVKNFDGSNSLFTLINSVNTRRAFIIQYTTAGLVNNVWYLPSNVRSETKNMYVGANKIYICGTYSSTSNSTINNLNGSTSIYTLPLTNASSGYYAGFVLAFDKTTFELNRINTIYSGNNNANENYISSVVEDSSGNVFACGTVRCDTNAQIKNFINNSTGISLNATLAQNGFIIRWDSNANYTGHWGWNLSSYACYVNDMAIVPGGNTLYVAMSIFTLGGGITIPNWNGGGSSSFGILGSSSYSNAIWSSCLFRFTGITTLSSPICNGRQSFGNNANIGYTPVPLSTVCYSTVYNIVYWATPATNNNQIAFFSNLTDSSYSLTISPPQSNQNNGILIFTLRHNDGFNTGYPAQIWGYSSTYSGADFIYRIRENTANGHVYLNGGIYSDNTPVFLGPVESQSRIQFPYNTGQGTSYYHAFSIKMNYNTPLGMSYIPFSRNQSYCSDICFPTSTRAIVINTISNHSSQFIRNYDQYNSPYSLPVTTAYNMGVLVDYSLTKTVSTYFTSAGIGIGRLNSGYAELEVEKGIYTSHFVQCNEIRINDYNQPFKFTDSIGREMGSLCRAWVCIDGIRAFQPVIKASMNVRYLEKVANGRYRIYFSQYAPNDRYSTFVSSTGYTSTNYTIFPFISTSATIGTPNWKYVYGIEVILCQTGGGSYDTAEFNVSCFW